MTTDDSLRVQFKRLTAAEALRALYIDFEGGRGKPPVLLGILRRGRKGTEPSVAGVKMAQGWSWQGSADM